MEPAERLPEEEERRGQGPEERVRAAPHREVRAEEMSSAGQPTEQSAYPLTVRAEFGFAASAINFLAGLWLIASPYVVGHQFVFPAARANDISVGIFIAVFAAIRVFLSNRAGWLSWVNAVLGLWLVMAPFALGYALYNQPLINDVVTGAIVVILGIVGGLASPFFFNALFGRGRRD